MDDCVGSLMAKAQHLKGERWIGDSVHLHEKRHLPHHAGGSGVIVKKPSVSAWPRRAC